MKNKKIVITELNDIASIYKIKELQYYKYKDTLFFYANHDTFLHTLPMLYILENVTKIKKRCEFYSHIEMIDYIINNYRRRRISVHNKNFGRGGLNE